MNRRRSFLQAKQKTAKIFAGLWLLSTAGLLTFLFPTRNTLPEQTGPDRGNLRKSEPSTEVTTFPVTSRSLEDGGLRGSRNDDCSPVMDVMGANIDRIDAKLLRNHGTVTGEVVAGEYHYYGICVSQHDHHHRIKITLRVLEGEVDLYASTSNRHPRAEWLPTVEIQQRSHLIIQQYFDTFSVISIRDSCCMVTAPRSSTKSKGSDWVSASPGDDSLSLPTYTDDFMGLSPNVLNLGVHGRPGGTYSLSTDISDVGYNELRAHSSLPLHPAKSK